MKMTIAKRIRGTTCGKERLQLLFPNGQYTELPVKALKTIKARVPDPQSLQTLDELQRVLGDEWNELQDFAAWIDSLKNVPDDVREQMHESYRKIQEAYDKGECSAAGLEVSEGLLRALAEGYDKGTERQVLDVFEIIYDDMQGRKPTTRRKSVDGDKIKK